MQPMNQQPYQPQPSYHPQMIGPQMGPIGPQYGAPYGMGMGTIGPVMGMPTRDPRGTMNKQQSELSLGSAEPNAMNIPNSLPTANIDPLPKDQSLEDGKLFLL